MLWDPDQHVVVVSPNVNFDKSSAVCSMADANHGLDGLQDAFGIQGTPPVKGAPCTEMKMRIETVDNDASKWESDTEILQPKVTEDEDVPNGPDPVVLPNLREPDMHICGHHHSEVE